MTADHPAALAAAYRDWATDFGRRSDTDAARYRMAEGLAAMIAATHPADAVQVMSAALDQLGAGLPQPPLLPERVRADAAFWADSATPVELEAYAAAALRVIERRAFCAGARKRLFATLWERFAPEDRRAFLTRVDPAGRFVAKGVAA